MIPERIPNTSDNNRQNRLTKSLCIPGCHIADRVRSMYYQQVATFHSLFYNPFIVSSVEYIFNCIFFIYFNNLCICKIDFILDVQTVNAPN